MADKNYLSGGKIILKTIILAVFIFILIKPAQAEEALPSPYFLFPNTGNYQTPSSLPIISGETRNDTLVNIYIDGQLSGAAKVINGPLLTGYFTYQIPNHLLSGNHTVKAVAIDQHWSEVTSQSAETALHVIPFPSPTLLVIQKDNNGQIIIKGVAKNDSTIRLYGDNQLIATFQIANHPSGTASFSWTAIAGQTFFATATDPAGKTSLNSNSVIVGQPVNLPASSENQKPAIKIETKTEPKIDIAPAESGEVKIDSQPIADENIKNSYQVITGKIKGSLQVWLWVLLALIVLVIIAWLKKNLNQEKSGEITARDIQLDTEPKPEIKESPIFTSPEPLIKLTPEEPAQPPQTKPAEENQENQQPPLDRF
ncbi:MAG: hypothetical protein V1692_00600 [bacterium]